ncbi:MAG: PadR family transcriptional regulator [Ramlibacter sp.]|nr:PadR family transcriptional regulator [Ramlibacter sp.]
MSLPHALLTALLEHPCSGSELAIHFDRSLGYFWHATHQQIYRELGRLEAAGWVESMEPEAGRGRKRAYRVLPAGRKELKRWVAEHKAPQPLRDEFMVRLRAEAAVGPTGFERDLDDRLELHLQKLALYRELEKRDFSGPRGARETQLQHLILTTGIMYEAFWIDVISNAAKILSAPPARDG